MTFQTTDFVRKENDLFSCAWSKSGSETPAIFIRVSTVEALGRAVLFLDRLIAREPVLRRQAAKAAYPNDSFWLADELGIASSGALEAGLQLSILDVRESDADTYQTRLVYAGPDHLQTITAKHVLVVDVAEDGGIEAFFDSYEED